MTQQAILPERFRSQATDDAVEIHPDDASSVALFFALSTQWDRHPFTGQRTGLKYSRVQPTADLSQLETNAATFRSLAAMEAAALDAWAEKSR